MMILRPDMTLGDKLTSKGWWILLPFKAIWFGLTHLIQVAIAAFAIWVLYQHSFGPHVELLVNIEIGVALIGVLGVPWVIIECGIRGKNGKRE